MLAFQFKKNTKGFVELKFKHKHSSKWLGEDQLALNPGFVLLTQCPPGAPDIIEPTETVMSPTHIVELTGVAMQRQMKPFMRSAGMGDDEVKETIKWLFDSANTGRMPYTSPALSADEEVHPRDWGHLVKMGVTGKEGDVYLLKPVVNCNNFWDLPKDLLQRHATDCKQTQKLIDEYNVPPKVGYRQAPTTARRSRTISTTNTIPVQNASDDSDQKSAAQEKQWGISVEECKVDSYVVVEMIYGKRCGKGVEVMKITESKEIFDDDKNSTSSSSSSTSDRVALITGDSYGPAKTRTKNKQIKSNNADCLSGRWLATGEKITVKTWAVMAVFKKLKTDDRLPQPVISKVLGLAQGKVVFEESDDETGVFEESVNTENQGEDKQGFIPPGIGLGDTASKTTNNLNLEVSQPHLEARTRASSRRSTRASNAIKR